jgi:hypothetical protein
MVEFVGDAKRLPIGAHLTAGHAWDVPSGIGLAESPTAFKEDVEVAGG